METINFALLAADEQAVAHNSLDMGSGAALLARNQKIINFSTLCLSRTRSIRNTKAAVSQLPNELLLTIFRIHSAVGPLNAWLRVTHVCSHWRILALSDPSLWTEIDCELPEPLAELLLLRSRNMPLSLSCGGDDVFGLPRILRTMFMRNAQVRHLSIRQVIAVTLLQALRPMLSNLKSLFLDRSLYTSPPLESDRLPNLCSLSAYCCSWELVLPFVRSLQTLELHKLYTRSDIATVLDALDACPALEALTFRNCLMLPVDDRNYRADRAVVLPKLKTLAIVEDSMAELGFVCSRLSLPADTNVHLEIECSWEETLPFRKKVAPVPHIVLKDQSLWPMLADAKCLAFGFHMENIVLHLSRNADSNKFPFLVAVLDITDDLPPAAAFLPEVLDMWLISMASPGVRTISIHGVPEETFPGQTIQEEYWEAMERFHEDLWPRILSSFPNLASLRLDCVQDITALANALCDTSGDVGVPAPELKRLILRCSLGPLVRSALLRALTYRNSRGARLDSLRLEPPRGEAGCTLPDNFVEDIAKLVKKLSLKSGTPGEEGYKKESEVEVSVDTSKPSAAVADEVTNEES